MARVFLKTTATTPPTVPHPKYLNNNKTKNVKNARRKMISDEMEGYERG